ncbi:hypothetical protein FKP32DRAFT_1598400 [Trametes sanguinea]|nr:hypothetical protein FKP32DRAFT_1598400 [Trametes sanguinea]
MNQGRATVSKVKFPTWAPSRSFSDTARQSPSASELPQLPPAPAYPCPFLTDEEIKHYLIPLYERGWTVQPSQTAKKPAPELVKRFEFESNSTSLKGFLEDINDVTEGENHHAALSTGSSPPSVTVRVHTHSGLRPASHPDEARKGRVQPGITLRDVRFAYLLEQRHANYSDAVVVEVPEEEQPTSAEALERRRRA